MIGNRQRRNVVRSASSDGRPLNSHAYISPEDVAGNDASIPRLLRRTHVKLFYPIASLRGDGSDAVLRHTLVWTLGETSCGSVVHVLHDDPGS